MSAGAKKCPSCGHLLGSSYVTTAQAARLSGVSPATVLRACRGKQIPARRTPGGHYRILTTDVSRWIRRGQ